MTRDEALEKLQSPAIDDFEGEKELEYVATKLGLSKEELVKIFNEPNKTHNDYKNQQALFNLGAKVLQAVGIEKMIKRWLG